MLTGDKLETAENIGESCKLINRTMEIHKLSTQEDVFKFCMPETVTKNDERLKRGDMMGILVEANALSFILESPRYKAIFLKISKTCEAVICCRVSPS